MIWLRLENNIVREIIPEAATLPSIAHWYGEAFANQCVQAPNHVEQNWLLDPDTQTFSPPPEFELPPEPEHIPELSPGIPPMLERRISDIESGLQFIEATLIQSGKMTIDDVRPDNWKNEVELILESRR